MFPMRVYLYLFAPFVFLSFYTFTRQKNILYTHQSFSIVIYISHTTVGKSTSQLFSITSYLFFLIAVFTLYKRKKKKDTRRYVFFFISFFLSVVFLKKRKKIILIILTVSFYHRIMLHHAYLRYILFSMFLRFCKHDKTDHRSRSISFIVSFRKKGYLFLYNFSCTFNPFSGRSHIICAQNFYSLLNAFLKGVKVEQDKLEKLVACSSKILLRRISRTDQHFELKCFI